MLFWLFKFKLWAIIIVMFGLIFHSLQYLVKLSKDWRVIEEHRLHLVCLVITEKLQIRTTWGTQVPGCVLIQRTVVQGSALAVSVVLLIFAFDPQSTARALRLNSAVILLVIFVSEFQWIGTRTTAEGSDLITEASKGQPTFSFGSFNTLFDKCFYP